MTLGKKSNPEPNNTFIDNIILQIGPTIRNVTTNLILDNFIDQ